MLKRDSHQPLAKNGTQAYPLAAMLNVGFRGTLLGNHRYGERAIFHNENESQLHDIASRLINAREEERSRVARELHDDLSQKIALLSLELEQFEEKIPESQNLKRNIQALQDRVSEISIDIQRISRKLHPAKLDHLGLAAAIKSFCREINDSGRLKVRFRQDGDFAQLPKDITLCAYRVSQEALQNCMKHSGARVARVALANDGRKLRLSVLDDGRGFDMDSEAINRGLGFTSMRERVRPLRGNIVVFSRPGHGTLVDVAIPLDEN